MSTSMVIKSPSHMLQVIILTLLEASDCYVFTCHWEIKVNYVVQVESFPQ